jgi:hypothetical protein
MPSRDITPSGCTIRSQPIAGSQEGSSSASQMLPATSRRPGSVVRFTSHAMGNPIARPSAADAALTHSEFVMAMAVVPLNACRRYVSVNHWEPWSNSRGEIARISELAQGTRMNRISSSQNSGMPSRPAMRPAMGGPALAASLPRTRRPGPVAAGPGASLSRVVVVVTSRDPARYLTMLESNQVLMVASSGPHLYGLMVWVVTEDSEGSSGSGFTPCSTG